jgi:hypothetical protein
MIKCELWAEDKGYGLVKVISKLKKKKDITFYDNYYFLCLVWA